MEQGNISALVRWLRNAAIFLTVELLLCNPLLPIFGDIAQANTPAATFGTLACPGAATTEDPSSSSSVDSTTMDATDNTGDDTPDAPGTFDADGNYTYIDKLTVAASPFASDLTNELNAYAQSVSGGWNVCTAQMNQLLGDISVSPQQYTYLDALSLTQPRIVFANSLDYDALTGEPCTKFDGTVCDETKETEPVYATDAVTGAELLNCNGTTTPVSASVTTSTPGCVPIQLRDADGNLETKQVPEYYDDSYWPNGQWDAPKADKRILEALDYLVTPVSEGGAGHEHIKVGDIISTDQTDPAFVDTSQGTSDTSATTDTGDNTQQPVSSHYYDSSDPSDPSQIAQSMDITEIDDIRVTTRITVTHHSWLGNSQTTSYQYDNPIPIQVAWQTQQGLQQSGGTPNLSNMYTGIQSILGGDINGLLDQLGLNLSIDPNSISVNSFGGIAEAIGSSMLSQLFQGGSLSGWDLGSTLNQFGHAYIAQKLGLPTNSLGTSDDLTSLEQSIGQATAEQALGLPAGALAGSTSQDIYTSAGRAYVENILKVSAGTLDLPASNTSQLQQNIGAGQIEFRFSLQPGSLQGATLSQLQTNSSLKAQLIFSSQSATNDDEDLGISGGTTEQLLESKISLIQYEQDVGKADISATLGQYTSSTPASGSQVTNQTQCSNNGSTTRAFFGATVANPDCRTDASTIFNSSIEQTILTQMGVDPDICGDPAAAQVKGVGLYSFVSQTVEQCPSISAVTNQALSSSEAQLLVSTGAFTQTGLQNLLTLADGTLQQGRYTITSGETNQQIASQASSTYNEVVDYWEPAFEQAQTNLNTAITATNDPTKQTKYQQALDDINGLISTDGSFQDGLVQLQDLSNQSGQAAALGLPGTIAYATNTTGEQTSTNLIPGNQDLVQQLLGGNLSVLGTIGKFVIAQSLTTDRPTQNQVVSQLTTNLSSVFTSLQQFGVSDTKLLQAGFATDDFQAIFQKNLSAETFQRVGTNALITALYTGTGAATAAGQLTTTGAALTDTQDLAQLAAGFSFYNTRVQELAKIRDQEVALLSGPQYASVEQQLQSVSFTLNGDPVTAAENLGRQLQALNKQVEALPNPQAVALAQQAEGIINEMIAGHSLNLSQQAIASNYSAPQGSSSGASCLSVGDLRTTLTSDTSSITKAVGAVGTVSGLAIKVAACQLDTSLSLPLGSTYDWYQTGKLSTPAYSYDSFLIAIGQTDATNRGQHIDTATAQTRGEEIVEAGAINAIVSAVPGLSSFASAYGINARTIYDMLTGNTRDIEIAIGGSLLDKYLNWTPGTGRQLISPLCTSVNPTIGVSTIVNCSAQQAQNIRYSAMANVALKIIGVDLNLPTTIDFNSGQDFLSSFGEAFMGEHLGLKTDTFAGSFEQVLHNNDPSVIAESLGLNDDPFTILLLSFENQLNVSLSGTTASPTDQTLYNDVVTTVTQRRTAETNTIQNGGSAYWQTPVSDTTANQLAAQSYASFVSQVGYLENQTTDPTLKADLQALVPASSSLSQYTEQFKEIIDNFQNRIGNFDSVYKLATGSFADFIQGKADAGQISQQAADAALAGNVIDGLYNDYAAANPSSPLVSIVQGLQTFSGGSSCTLGDIIGTGQTVLAPTPGQSAAGFTVKKKDTCQLDNLTQINWQDLLTGQGSIGQSKQYQNDRVFLFDHLLGRTFSNAMEKDMGIQAGSIEKMIINPQLAPEILFSQGVQQLASDAFPHLANNSQCTSNSIANLNDISSVDASLKSVGQCAVETAAAGLDSAFVAALYNPGNETLTNFSGQRAVAPLEQAMDTEENLAVQTISKSVLGVPITNSDVEEMASGQVSALSFIGLQEVVNGVNSSLDLSQPGASGFGISYATVRAAVGFGPVGDVAYQNIENQDEQIALAGYLQNIGSEGVNVDSTCDTSNPGNSCVNPAAVIANAQKTDPALVVAYTPAAQADAKAAVNNYAAQIQKTAQQELQYKLWDAALFKADPHITPGFSQAVFGGTATQRLGALAGFAFNSLDFGQKIFGGLLSQSDVSTLTEYAASDFTQGDLSAGAITSAVGHLDTWATGYLNTTLHLDVPSGIVTSFTAWASTGFSAQEFTGKVDAGIFKGQNSFGTVLLNDVDQKIFAFTDKALGLKAGGSLEIYQGIQGLISAEKALQAAKAVADVAILSSPLVDVGSLSLGISADVADQADNSVSGANSAVSKANSNVATAEAGLASTIVDVVFSQQLSQLDSNLGLAPGSSAELSSILISALIPGAAFPWAALAGFVILNLIGFNTVQTSVEGTADGYYPYVGNYGDSGYVGGNTAYYENPDPDYALGTFNPRNQGDYQSYLISAAQEKVRSVLANLLVMPTQWGAATGITPQNLWVSQVYTDREEDLQNLDYLISQPAPYDTPTGWGYGPVSERAEGFTENPSTGEWSATTNGQRFGYFFSPTFWNEIHVRW
jgi:hypothetical protein